MQLCAIIEFAKNGDLQKYVKSGCLSLADSQFVVCISRQQIMWADIPSTTSTRKVPLDERYLENLRLIWEEKVGSQRELRLKTQDSLIGRKRSLEDYGLPPLDFSQPKIAYRYREVWQRSDATGARKAELAEKITGHKYDRDSHAAQVALATTKPKWLANRIAAMLVYRQAHLRWLSINDSEKFDKVVKDLKIAYHVPMQGFETDRLETRKTWSEKMLELETSRKRRIDYTLCMKSSRKDGRKGGANQSQAATVG
uniref:Uncharacterized protein n=1 Tax=Ditylenchus dipsaci TaxID=166011 RepID=A0A915D1R2_9BILA